MEVQKIEAPKPVNERSVHIVPAYVRPGRQEPDAEIFDSDDYGEGDSPLEEGFHTMDNISAPVSIADDMLEVAYTAILGGTRGRRALSRRLNTTEHMAISLIERLKGQGRLDRNGRPVNASPIQHRRVD